MTYRRIVIAITLLFTALALSPASAFGAAVNAHGWYWPVGRDATAGDFVWLQNYPGHGYHLAHDFMAPLGTNVVAIAGGTVVDARMNVGGYGPGWGPGGAVVIRHKTAGGQQFLALYGHLKNLRVKKNGTVAPGKVVGEIGPWDNGTHLHFGICPGTTLPNNIFQGYTKVKSQHYGRVDPVLFLNSKQAPPACVSDAKPLYADRAAISITPVLSKGVASVSYKLDAKDVVTKPGALARAKTTVLGQHRLIFWATTPSGTDGPRQTATFTVVRSGSITATVYDAHDVPLAGVAVTAQDATSGEVRGSGTTSVLGQCTIASLLPGDYRVYFGAPLNEWYDNSTVSSGSKVVPVASGTRSAVSASQGGATTPGERFSICGSVGDPALPAISGHTVIWVDRRSDAFGDIYARDISSDAPDFALSTADGPQEFPAISGDIAAWKDRPDTYTNTTAHILGSRLSSGEGLAICTQAGVRESPAISGSVVVWSDYRGGHWNVYGNDLAKSAGEFLVSAEAVEDSTPSISGDWVVWMENRNGDWDVYGRRLSDTGGDTAIATGPEAQLDPDISGTLVAWSVYRNGNWDVYGRDLSNGSGAFPICTAPGDQTNVAVSGSKVVWMDFRNGNADIYGKDLSSGRDYVISTDSGDQYTPDISGNIVVWTDGDIYGMQLP